MYASLLATVCALASSGLFWPTAGATDAPADSVGSGTGVTVSGPSSGETPWIEIPRGRVTAVDLDARVGQPFESRPEFLERVPSYRRGMEMDSEQRWLEASGCYQQALVEIAATHRLHSPPLPSSVSSGPPSAAPALEAIAFKIDLERRHSRALVEGPSAAVGISGVGAPPPARPSPAPGRLSALERGRLLRMKVMAARSATGAVPEGLVSATLRALRRALRESAVTSPRTDPSDSEDAESGNAPNDAVPSPRGTGGDPEIRLLLCATRAVNGDRRGARLELAHVTASDREDPRHALALAFCQAALGHDEDALGSLAVAVDRLGPSLRFVPSQARDLESSNDWDRLRADPRFQRIFH